MTPSDFTQLPPGIQILVVVMLWPAIWAGVSLIVTFAGDLIRGRKVDLSAEALPQEAPGSRHGQRR
jgi:hypothetical protein